jgi:hypothetical protein
MQPVVRASSPRTKAYAHLGCPIIHTGLAAPVSRAPSRDGVLLWARSPRRKNVREKRS